MTKRKTIPNDCGRPHPQPHCTCRRCRRLAEHPMYTASDLAYLRGKGYSDDEILAFWNRDHAAGCAPVQHKPAPDVVGTIARKRPDTYEITRADGRKTRVTVPGRDEAELFNNIREQFSPHAVASIIAHLQGARTNNTDVDRQVHWFTERLVALLGGHEHQARLAEELGL